MKQANSSGAGVLYIVATPIGNLGDMSKRAVETLKSVSIIAAEDTRHTRPLLHHFGIKTELVSHHAHNEAQSGNLLIERMRAGQWIALVSDAGTPLISDPGERLVKRVIDEGMTVVPVPGPCALISALCVSGLATRPNVSRKRAMCTVRTSELVTLLRAESSSRALKSSSSTIFGWFMPTALEA